MLVGLELLVAGDVIRTVVVDPTLASVAVLGSIVLIRTFLSITSRSEVATRRDEDKSIPHGVTAA